MMTRNGSKFFTSLFLLFALALPALPVACGCGDDDDDDDDDSDDIVDDDDDTGDDDFWPDDDTQQLEGLERIEITPSMRAIPKGFSKAFSAAAYYEGGTTVTQADFVYDSSDNSVMSVDGDGAATGVKNGSAVLSARLGEVVGEAQITVGADIFFFNGVTGYFGSYDRGRDRVSEDHFGFGQAVAQFPVDMQIAENYACIADRGDDDETDSPGRDIIILDLSTGQYQTLIIPGLSRPRDLRIVDDQAFVTGTLSDNFARIDLVDLTSEIYELPEGCGPNGLEVMYGRAFVACNYFDADQNTYGDPGRIADVDLESGETALIDTTQVNPGSLALSADESSLYVVCTGDYAGRPGSINEIDLAAGQVRDFFSLGLAPGDIAINSEGLAFIGENLAGNVYVVDTGDNTVVRGADDPVKIDGAWWTYFVRISPFSGHVFVADWLNSKTVILDSLDFSVVDKIDTENAGGYIFWE